jgi:hypothetical protein
MPSARYIPKLAELLKVTERRGKTVPHHGSLQIHDPSTTAESDYLYAEEAKLFRSALGICIFLSQEMYDIQHTVRVLATYMAKPTKTSMCAIKKFALLQGYEDALS